MYKIAFIDRDGVINQDPKEKYYVHNLSEFILYPGVKEAVRKLKQANFKVFIVSNQTGVGKGEVDFQDLNEITFHMMAEFAASGAKLDGIHYCTCPPEDDCDCRKPKTGLFEEALEGVDADKNQMYLIGDSERDIQAGSAFGCKTILVLTGKSKREDEANFMYKPNYVADNLEGAVHWILN